jgi:hypothetical protein
MDTRRHDGRQKRSAPDSPAPGTGARREFRRQSRLAVELTVALVVKLVALAAIWNIWFAHPASKRLDAPSIGAAVYSSEAAKADGGRAHARP